MDIFIQRYYATKDSVLVFKIHPTSLSHSLAASAVLPIPFKILHSRIHEWSLETDSIAETFVTVISKHR